MKNNSLTKILLLSTLALTTSCAGLISGKTQNAFIRTSDGSENVKAEITSISGTQTVNLPASVVLPRGNVTVSIAVKEEKCFLESKTYVTPKYNIWLLADAIGGVFGLTGTTTDMSSGAAWAYEDNIIVNIRKNSNKSCK